MAEPARPFAATESGVRVRVRVTPKARRNAVAGVQADASGALALKVQVTAAPEDGKANAAVIKLLAKEWRLPKGDLGVAAGAKDRNKTIAVAGDPGAVMDRLSAWMEGHNG